MKDGTIKPYKIKNLQNKIKSVYGIIITGAGVCAANFQSKDVANLNTISF